MVELVCFLFARYRTGTVLYNHFTLFSYIGYSAAKEWSGLPHSRNRFALSLIYRPAE